MARRASSKSGKSVEALKHSGEKRRNLPSAEHEPIMRDEDKSPIRIALERRNTDLDPQLVWRGKSDDQLEVAAPPLYIQERVHPKVLIDDLARVSRQVEQDDADEAQGGFADIFADFNGLPSADARTEFYQHDANWSNRMILGDSLQVMASLAEREELSGKVQCIYIDPPYGIRFNSNFQWSTTSRDVQDGKRDHITREPEQVKAFRDTWRDGIHSYLSYLRDRLTIARDLLTDSGSIFVQIGDENVHRVRSLMDEVFGEENFCCLIFFRKTGGQASTLLSSIGDYIIWFSKDKGKAKYRQLYADKTTAESRPSIYRWAEAPDVATRRRMTSPEIKNETPIPKGWKIFAPDTLVSLGATPAGTVGFEFEGRQFHPGSTQHWKTTVQGMTRLKQSRRLINVSTGLYFVRYLDSFPVVPRDNMWQDTSAGGYTDDKSYVVQTNRKVIERCILMTTDPGDLVLDPTCGSGTAAYVAEQWGRRWVTIDTSRVALALARMRIMGARYPYYLLADSVEGQAKEAALSRRDEPDSTTYGDVRQGFVYERVPHITLRDIANNAEIDVIWDNYQHELEPLRARLNEGLGMSWEEWEVSRQAESDWSEDVQIIHREWWVKRIARQKEIDASIAANAENEYLYDKPYEDRNKVRVAGPFTVESVSPHRTLGVDENGNPFDSIADAQGKYGTGYDFGQVMLENLKRSGVQQAHRDDRIEFSSLSPWPGDFVCADGRYIEGGSVSANGDEISGGKERRAAIFIGPEFGTVSRPDLVEAAREAADAKFDVLIACAFNYDAHSAEFEKLGKIPVLKARMNADLHMADDLKNTGKGNLFVIFGEPDIDVLDAPDDQIQVRVNGVDVFHPNSGEVRSDGPEGIACWFIDTDYNEEAFFVRQAYFLGASDPYKSLKTTLRAEINEEAWASLNRDVSRPFDKPSTGRLAVKVINHLGDEVMKVYRVS